VSPFAVDFFAYPLRSVNGAPDSAGEAPGCSESPRQDPPTGAARRPTRSSACRTVRDTFTSPLSSNGTSPLDNQESWARSSAVTCHPLGNQLPDDLHHVDRGVEHDQVAQQRVPPCWWPRSPVPAAPSRRGTAAAPRSASRARPPGTPCRSGFARTRRQSAHQRHRRHFALRRALTDTRILARSTADRVRRFRLGCGTIILIRQLQLFTTAELAKMRDRTKARNYSAERDEFRRTHERHRAWGLARRHAEKLRRLYGRSADPRPAATSKDDRTEDPSPARTAPPTSRQAGGPTTGRPAPSSPTGDTPSAERKLPQQSRSPAMPRQARQSGQACPGAVNAAHEDVVVSHYGSPIRSSQHPRRDRVKRIANAFLAAQENGTNRPPPPNSVSIKKAARLRRSTKRARDPATSPRRCTRSFPRSSLRDARRHFRAASMNNLIGTSATRARAHPPPRKVTGGAAMRQDGVRTGCRFRPQTVAGARRS